MLLMNIFQLKEREELQIETGCKILVCKLLLPNINLAFTLLEEDFEMFFLEKLKEGESKFIHKKSINNKAILEIIQKRKNSS